MAKTNSLPRCVCGHAKSVHRVSPVEPVVGSFLCLDCYTEGRDWEHRFERQPANAQIRTERRQQRTGCQGKKKYPSLKAALHVSVRMHKQYPAEQFNAYRCLFDVHGDEHYHVGHLPNGPLQH